MEWGFRSLKTGRRVAITNIWKHGVHLEITQGLDDYLCGGKLENILIGGWRMVKDFEDKDQTIPRLSQPWRGSSRIVGDPRSFNGLTT